VGVIASPLFCSRVSAGRRWPGLRRHHLPIEVVALEDVTEQVSLQVLIDDGGEIEHRSPNRRAGDLGLIGGACCDQVGACGNGAAGLPARRVLNAALPARLHDLQQLPQRIEASGKADIGVELYQDLPGVTDGQARI
jgi:hypothetical protein